MLYIIRFEDNPNADADIRVSHMPLHLEFLEANAGQIVAAGPLFGLDDSGQGGLWIVDVPDAETAEQLIRQDPFWETGLRKSHQILRWKQVFAEGKRQI